MPLKPHNQPRGGNYLDTVLTPSCSGSIKTPCTTCSAEELSLSGACIVRGRFLCLNQVPLVGLSSRATRRNASEELQGTQEREDGGIAQTLG